MATLRRRSVELVCGDPETKPASFSRFVLPFAYSLQEVPGPAGGPSGAPEAFYRRLSIDELDPGARRRHYLTRDTADGLFLRAAWYELARPGSSSAGVEFSARRRAGGEGSYRVRIAAPRLVLFEFSEFDASRGTQGDVLGTGFVLLDLTFPDPSSAPTLEDLRELNEVFRLWRKPFDGHDDERGYRHILGDCPLDLTAPAGADAVRVADASTEGGDGPDAYLDRWLPLFRPELEAPSRRGRARAFVVFPSGDGRWNDQVRAWVRDPLVPEPGWAVYPDARAFVWTCALVPDGAGALRSPADGPEGSTPQPWADPRWIELLDVDPPGYAGPTPGPYQMGVTREGTYLRWAHLGTLYGFTVHSGAMLGPPIKRPAIHRHFAESYFDQTLLLLYVRITSLRFSERLRRLTAQLRSHGRKRVRRGPWEEEFGDLREDFAVFTNLYEFPRVSNQEQGIEMYSLARKVLDVEAFFDELEDEIRSAHEHFDMRRTQEQTRIMLLLTLVATLGLPLAVVTGFFGMNFFVEDVFFHDYWPYEAWKFVAVLAFSLLGVYFVLRLGMRYEQAVIRFLLRGARRRRR